MGGGASRDKPSVDVPDEFKVGAGVGLADKILKAKEMERVKEVKEKEKKSKGMRSVSIFPTVGDCNRLA